MLADGQKGLLHMKKLRKYGSSILTMALGASFLLNVYLLIHRQAKVPDAQPEICAEVVQQETDISHITDSEVESSREEPQQNPTSAIYGIQLASWIDTIRDPLPIPRNIDLDLRLAMWEATKEVFANAPDSFLSYERFSYTIPYISDTIFCSYLKFGYIGEDPYHGEYQYSTELCLTYDLKTGKILGLDDILDITAFEELIHIEGYLNFPEGSGSLDGPQQDQLDFYKERKFLTEEIAKLCDPSVTELHRPSFYLVRDRIWFEGLGDYTFSILFVKYEDIRDILKIEVGEAF